MEQTAERLTIERTVEIEATPETVWGLLVDPELAKRWWGLDAKLDPEPGGEFMVRIHPGRTARGVFVEVDEPRRLVYTFGWELTGELPPSPIAPGSTTVEITLEPSGGGTTLTFVHRGLVDQEAFESHSMGWDHYLSRLATVAAGGDPGPDPWAQQS